MGKGTKKDNNKDDVKKNEENGVFGFFKTLTQVFKWELYSPVGKANLVFDFLLAAIIVVFVIGDSATSIAGIISSIFKDTLKDALTVTEKNGDSIIVLILIFVAWCAICLFVIYLTRKEINNSDIGEIHNK